MIDYHRFCQIKHLHEQQGLHAAQIAKELSLDPRTVAYWLTQEHFRPRKPTPRSSKLDPFKKEIVRLLEPYPYAAAQVLQRLCEQGFDGGYSIGGGTPCLYAKTSNHCPPHRATLSHLWVI